MLDFLGEDAAAARVHKAISHYVGDQYQDVGPIGSVPSPTTAQPTTAAIGDAIAERL